MNIILLQDTPNIEKLEEIKTEASELDMKIKLVEEIYEEIMDY